MSVKIEFDVELLSTETQDETLQAKMAEINKALGPLIRAYGEVRRQLTTINVKQLKEQWEEIKKQCKAKKKEIEQYRERKSALQLRVEAAMQRSVDAERHHENLVRSAPKDTDFPDQSELDNYSKKVSASEASVTSTGRRCADLQSEYQRLIQQSNRNSLDGELRSLMQRELELREQIKELEAKPSHYLPNGEPSVYARRRYGSR